MTISVAVSVLQFTFKNHMTEPNLIHVVIHLQMDTYELRALLFSTALYYYFNILTLGPDSGKGKSVSAYCLIFTLVFYLGIIIRG